MPLDFLIDDTQRDYEIKKELKCGREPYTWYTCAMSQLNLLQQIRFLKEFKPYKHIRRFDLRSGQYSDVQNDIQIIAHAEINIKVVI